MTDQAASSQTVHRWYARPVFFVADVNRAIRFYVDMLGFQKHWHIAMAQEPSARSIAENARSFSVRTPRAETGHACSWS